MKKTATSKKTKRLKEPNWKEAATELAQCAIFAVKFLRTKSGSGMRVKFAADGTMKTLGPWEDTFFDALDKVGFCVDRKAFYAERDGKKARKR